MVQLIKPKLTDFGKDQKKEEEVKSQIPTDPKGIKEYLEIIPNPVGYRMLVRPWSGKAKTKGGVILADETQDKIQMTTVVGLVVKWVTFVIKIKKNFQKVRGVKKENLLFMADTLDQDFKLNTVNTVYLTMTR